MIKASDGKELLLSIHGQSVDEFTGGHKRAILARIELTTEADCYRWLNTCFLIGEGEIDEQREHWWLDAYVCINEHAQGPPALGAQPPERFRYTAVGDLHAIRHTLATEDTGEDPYRWLIPIPPGTCSSSS
jgi:hypothetical protein